MNPSTPSPRRHRHPCRPAAARGFTLVELMVGLVIAMLLMIATSSVYLAQRRSYDTQGDVADIQASARAIGQLLQREARQAGYSDFTYYGNDFGTAKPLDATNDDGVNTSDSVTFRYFGSSKAGGDPTPGAVPASAPVADGSAVNCLGENVNGNFETVETFSVVNDAAGTPWLQCTVNGAPTPLFQGVEFFQVLLGEDTDNDDTINRYVPPGIANMGNVRALRISMVLRGAARSNPKPASFTLNHFGKGYAAADSAPAGDAGSVAALPDDGRLRKHISFYIAVRNRLN
ncbi:MULTISPECIES: PilW family protein [Cupriavidus]|uniref:PilW family protein n=1 Tax=Cupriavidus TaxID=106589 RepID=UPI0003705D58|nr:MULTISPECIES: PilW family protein [Cupriavidus]